jgi:hypothetical protein
MGDPYRCNTCRPHPNRCVKCRERRAAVRNDLRARRRKARLCSECGNKAVAGLSRCADHRDDNNERSSAAHIARRTEEDT